MPARGARRRRCRLPVRAAAGGDQACCSRFARVRASLLHRPLGCSLTRLWRALHTAAPDAQPDHHAGVRRRHERGVPENPERYQRQVRFVRARAQLQVACEFGVVRGGPASCDDFQPCVGPTEGSKLPQSACEARHGCACASTPVRARPSTHSHMGLVFEQGRRSRTRTGLTGTDIIWTTLGTLTTWRIWASLKCRTRYICLSIWKFVYVCVCVCVCVCICV